MPAHPREGLGLCASLGADSTPFDGTYAPYATGGAGAGTLAAGSQQAYGDWPPATIPNVVGGGAAAGLPQYVATAPVNTLPPATFTYTAISGKQTTTRTITGGDGWANDNDRRLAPATAAGCQYLDPWDAVETAPPAECAAATGAAAANGYGAAAAAAAPTPPPRFRRA
jgi:glucan 1,3-beta-glucosidase